MAGSGPRHFVMNIEMVVTRSRTTDGSAEYIPMEIAILDYDDGDPATDTFHTFVDPGDLPDVSEVRYAQQNIHGIFPGGPDLPFGCQELEGDIDRLWARMTNWLAQRRNPGNRNVYLWVKGWPNDYHAMTWMSRNGLPSWISMFDIATHPYLVRGRKLDDVRYKSLARHFRQHNPCWFHQNRPLSLHCALSDSIALATTLTDLNNGWADDQNQF